jgi:uncharacterized protein with GYD domain
MATFVMLGKYSAESMRQMSAQRTKKALKLIQQCSGTVEAMYATLGPYDLVFIVSFPTTDDAMKASIGLSKLTGIGFTTSPAVAVVDFDNLLGGIPK